MHFALFFSPSYVSSSLPNLSSSPPLPSLGAVCCISWSPSGSLFAVASTSHCVQVYCGSGREYVPATEIKELQVSVSCSQVSLPQQEGEIMLNF